LSPKIQKNTNNNIISKEECICTALKPCAVTTADPSYLAFPSLKSTNLMV